MRSNILDFLAIHLGAGVIVILGRLARIEVRGREHLLKLREDGQRYIFTLWHGRMLLPIYLHRREGIRALVSLHRDGELIARTLTKLGYTLVRGSSTRGGGEAFYQMAAHLVDDNVPVAVIPDGPKGPAQTMKPGVITLAQKTGAWLLPMTFSVKPGIRLKSWDRHMIPLPFAKGVILYGEPMLVPASCGEEERERYRLEMENRLNDLVVEADRLTAFKSDS
jgi:lysophospholipid acyltransferase (LPLAT)-like uncharacterized protein